MSKTKGDREIEQLEQLHRLRKRGQAPINTDPRFALAFAYESNLHRAQNEAAEQLRLERRKRAPWTTALRKGWWNR